jgi:N-acetylglucosamine kinase-like BadF-type ATPase
VYYLGIDGGGSQTRALLCDASGQVFGRGLSGPSNPRTASESTLQENLLSAIRLAVSGIETAKIHAAYFGVAGATDPINQGLILKIAHDFFENQSPKITVDHDMEIALEGGLKGAPGLVLIAGTGSSSYGRNAAGLTAECGGWGDLVDDVGSGSWIGLEALQTLVRQADGRLPKSSLMNAVVHFLGIEGMSDFKTRIHDQGLTRSERARLAPIVIDLAQSGDLLATRIVSRAVQELCKLAKNVSQKLELPKPTICLCGGLMQNPYFQDALCTALRLDGFDSAVTCPHLEPVSGALMLALKSANITVHEQTIIKLVKAQATALPNK